MLLKIFMIAVLAYLGLCVYFYFFQDRYIFYPARGGAQLPAGSPLEAVVFDTADGETLHGWWAENDPDAPAVLFFHGNAGNISHRTHEISFWSDMGVNGLLFDYRGYGQSTGKIKTEEQFYMDCRAALDFLREEKGFEDKNIVLWGRSLGAAGAIELSFGGDFRAVIIESAFTSVPDAGRDIYPFLPLDLLARFRFDNLNKIGRVGESLLIIHSRDDQTIGFSHGERLFKAAAEPKEFIELNGTHNDAYIVSGDKYRAGINNFINTNKDEET